MKPFLWCAMFLAAMLASCATVSDQELHKELFPTGKLRVGIGVGVSPSAFWATRDPATGRPRGVTVDRAIAPPEPGR